MIWLKLKTVVVQMFFGAAQPYPRSLQVDARLLRICTISGKVALESKMIQSQATYKWMLPEYAKRMPNGFLVGTEEVALCTWTKKYHLTEDTMKCKLCGLVFSKQFMNTQGEFKLLRECLDGKRDGVAFPEPGYLARNFPKYFSGVSTFDWVSSSTNVTHVLFGKKSMFGLNVKVFAVIADGDLRGLRLRGKLMWGRRNKGSWHLLEGEA